MEIESAKRLIASYTTGRRVSAADLAAACRVAGRDRDWVLKLKAELGLSGPPEDFCAVFEARVAEYREHPEILRPAELSSLFIHLAECPACRELHDLMPADWIPYTAVHPREALPALRLVKPLRLRFASRGRLSPVGTFPAPVRADPVEEEMSLSGGASPGLALIEWYLPLPDVGLEALLSVHPEGGDKVAVSVQMEPHVAGGAPKLEVRSEGGRRLLHVGRVEDSVRSPIVLPAGTFEIHLRHVGEQDYVIDLDLLAEDDENRAGEAEA